MIRAVPGVAAMGGYVLADLGNSDAVSLAQNESAFPSSPNAIAAGQAAVARATVYPDPDWCDLRAAIAAGHDLPAEHLLCGAGSMELIGCLIRAFAGPGDEVLGSDYGYLFVATACQQSGARYVKVPEPDMAVSVNLLLAAVTAATRIVFLCNPGNPTGTRIANSEVLRLRAKLPADVLLVVDQAYGEFDDQDPTPIFNLVARGDTVVLRTFSKAYGLASARVGWGYFPPGIGTETRKLLNPNNISGVSQAMAGAAMRDQAYMIDVLRQTAQIRDRFLNRVRKAGLTVPQSHTNFVLVQFPTADEAVRADAELRQAGFILRRMEGYGLPDCLRATVGDATVMHKVAEIIQKLADGRTA